jgi:hypothetical protein
MINFSSFEMQKKASYTSVKIALILLILFYAELLNAQQNECIPKWTNSATGHCTGFPIVTKDIDNDGIAEIICGSRFEGFQVNLWLIYKFNPLENDYKQIWTSTYYETAELEYITAIDAFDVDGDGDIEILIGTASGIVQVFDGRTRHIKQLLKTSRNPLRFLMADADNDGLTELVISTFDSTNLFYAGNLDHKLIIPFGSLDIKCGNVDQEPSNELVYAPGKVIRLINDSIEIVWLYNQTKYGMVELADIDSDGMNEIFYDARQENIKVYDADLQKIKYSIETQYDYYSFIMADVNDDGISEILLSQSDGVWGGIYCYNAQNGEELWRVYNPEKGSMDINVADTDGDGNLELVWNGKCGYFTYNSLFIYDISTLDQEWKSDFNPVPYMAVKVRDLDNDNIAELILLSNYTSDIKKSRISVYDLESNLLNWVWNTWEFSGLYGFLVSDVDNDGQNEILLAGGSLNSNGLIAILNPVTQELKSVQVFDNLQTFYAIALYDLDNDGLEEFIVATKSQIHIINSIDYSILWSSAEFHSYVDDATTLIIGNIDTDSNPEILFLNGSILCIDGLTFETWETQERHFSSLSLIETDNINIDEIIAGSSDGQIFIINGQTQNLTLLPIHMPSAINSICAADLTDGGSPEIIFTSGGILHFGDVQGNIISTTKIGDVQGKNENIEISDYNNDGLKEVFVSTCYQIVEFGTDCVKSLEIPEYLKTETASVYPNPSKNQVILKLNSLEPNSKAFVEIYSLMGIRLTGQTLYDKRTTLNLANLSKGIYVLKVTIDGGQTVLKIVKE